MPGIPNDNLLQKELVEGLRAFQRPVGRRTRRWDLRQPDPDLEPSHGTLLIGHAVSHIPVRAPRMPELCRPRRSKSGWRRAARSRRRGRSRPLQWGSAPAPTPSKQDQVSVPRLHAPTRAVSTVVTL